MSLPVVEHPSDGELAARALRGEPAAVAALYRRHAPELHRLAYRLTGSSADAEDVVQDLFVGLPVALRRYEERGTLASWLRVLATRVALDLLRRRRRRPEEPLDDVGAAGNGRIDATRPAAMPRADDALDALDALAVRDAVAALPDDYRVVFVLREVEGYTHAEIGRMLGIRAGTSQVRLHRAVRMLRAHLRGAP